MGIKFLQSKYGRIIRDIYGLLLYPIWLISAGMNSPDNHIYKKRRIASVAKEFDCSSFIETGTYYGQMVNFAKKKFLKVKSVEIHPPFFLLNKKQFERDSNVEIYSGKSQDVLSEMINSSEGRILFWLDGHYSGVGTGGGDDVCPITKELRLIAQSNRKDHCILIDDARCFIDRDGYPTLDETLALLREINSSYRLMVDRDCIMATFSSAA